MKNITVTVPDEIYLLARVHAAKRGTSVSALVRRFLEFRLERSFPGIDLPHGKQHAAEGIPTPPPCFL
jgi:negative regulator of replication initiation